MKKIISIILCLIFVTFSFTGCFSLIGGYATERRGPAMWIVEDRDGNRCYLFATNHTGKASDEFPLADVIEDAYSFCDYLAVECDYTSEGETIPSGDGTSILEHISETVYNAAVASIKRHNGDYNGEYDYESVAFWYGLLDSFVTKDCGFDSAYGTDIYFINKAKNDNKTIYEVEGFEYQTELSQRVSDKVYENFIISMLNNRSSSGMEYYNDLYRSGDMATLEYTLNSGRNAKVTDAALAEQLKAYFDMMYTERNARMADALYAYLTGGKRVFFAVGASHVVGDDGIVKLLKAKGCRVYRK